MERNGENVFMENFKTASGRIPMSSLKYKTDSHKVNTDLISCYFSFSHDCETNLFSVTKRIAYLSIQQYFPECHLPPKWYLKSCTYFALPWTANLTHLLSTLQNLCYTIHLYYFLTENTTSVELFLRMGKK